MSGPVNNFLVKLAAYDAKILSFSSEREIRQATISGKLLTLVFSLSVLAFYLTFYWISQSIIFSGLLAILVSLFLMNIYRLVLITSNSQLLPHIRHRKAPWVSYIIKTIYVLFFAFICSKPIELMIFHTWIKKDIAQFRLEQVEEMKQNLASSPGFDLMTISFQIDSISMEMDTLQERLRQTDSSDLAFPYLIQTLFLLKEDLVERQTMMEENIKQTEAIIASYQRALYQSPLFIQSLKILFRKYPFSWGLTIVLFILYFLPYYLKIKIVRQSSKEEYQYERIKSSVEDFMIRDSYQKFKNAYQALFLKEFEQDVQFYERHFDPPYNRIEKSDQRNYLPNHSLKNWIIKQHAP